MKSYPEIDIEANTCLTGNRLMKEEADGNWLYSIDGLAPLEI